MTFRDPAALPRTEKLPSPRVKKSKVSRRDKNSSVRKGKTRYKR